MHQKKKKKLMTGCWRAEGKNPGKKKKKIELSTSKSHSWAKIQDALPSFTHRKLENQEINPQIHPLSAISQLVANLSFILQGIEEQGTIAWKRGRVQPCLHSQIPWEFFLFLQEKQQDEVQAQE